MRVICPACRTKARVTHSEAITPTDRRAYCQCCNPACGWTGSALLTVISTLTPSRLAAPAPTPAIPPEVRTALLGQLNNAT